MGDYTKNGTKIGTCGDAYYATLEMLERAAANGANDDVINYYIDPKRKARFAFPFPEYEGKNIGEISNFHEGERAEFTFEFETEESAHKEIVHHLHPKGAPGINIYTSCPYSEGGKASNNLDKKKKIFRLVGQCFQNGELLMTAECVYCKCLNVFSNEEALQVAEQLRQEAEREMKFSKNLHNSEDKERSRNFVEYRQAIVKKILEMVERNSNRLQPV